jgi:hypothetical protein
VKIRIRESDMRNEGSIKLGGAFVGTKGQRIAICLVLAVVSLATRFAMIGWPFAGDEIATLWEERILFHGDQAPINSQAYRLPHAIPLGYFVIHLSHLIFGSGELGSRALLAVLSSASIVLTFLAVERLFGRKTALATSALLVLWPEHVYQSQQTRFYMVGAFFSYAAMLVGAIALKRNSVLAVAICAVLSIAATLSHTLLAAVLPLVFLAYLVGCYADKRKVSKQIVVAFGGGHIALALILIVWVFPYIKGWNQGEMWGYSVVHALLAAIVSVGFPVALMAGIGAAIMVAERRGQNWFWLTCLIAWAFVPGVLPLVVTYNPNYGFLLTAPVFVAAGLAVSRIFDLLWHRYSAAAFVWGFVSCVSNLPSFASHYIDGSRPDLRSAAQYVSRNWSNGDRISGFSMGTFRYYASGCCEPTIPLSTNGVRQLTQLARDGERIWIVVESSRGGLAEDLQNWLLENSSHRFQVRRRRFDYAEYGVDVFLYTPS